MTNPRKVCVFKNCQSKEGQTFFKFPTDIERFKGELIEVLDKLLVCLRFLYFQFGALILE